METCNAIEIGNRIRGLREARDLTQATLAEELSKQLGCTIKRETVNYWEKGTRDLKTDYTVVLAKFFNETCDYILRGIKAENVDIHEKTGLEDDPIKAVTSLKDDYPPECMQIVNALLSGENFINLVVSIQKYAFDDRKLFFGRNVEQHIPSYDELNDDETNNYRLFKLTKKFDEFIRGVINNLERSRGNGKHSGTQE